MHLFAGQEVKMRKKNTVYLHIYMESRKMILMRLFAGPEQRCRQREQICRPRRAGGRGRWHESGE